MIHFQWQKFSELSSQRLYEILRLRSEVFVVEQNCIYQDIDNRDFEAHHLLGLENNALATYARLFPPTESRPTLVFGRVLTAQFARNRGYAKNLLTEILAYSELNYPGVSIECSAQYYLKQFYESFGFQTVGDVYQEENIPHIKMILQKF